MEPGKGSLHDVTDLAEAGPVGGISSSDLVRDAALGDESAVFIEVISAVGVERSGLAAWVAHAAAHGWDAIQKRHELGDIVAIA